MSIEAHDYNEDILRRYEHWTVYLHNLQRYLGQSYIALNRTGDLDPFTDTTSEERSELIVVVDALTTCISELYRPDKYNYANLRNEWHHCHWHVIPRYEAARTVCGFVFEDKNWGHNYSPYADGLIVPEPVVDTIKADMRTLLTQ